MNNTSGISPVERDKMLAFILGIPVNSVALMSKGALENAVIALSQQANRATTAATEWMLKLYDENQNHPAFEKMSEEVKVKMEAARIIRTQPSPAKEEDDA
jgi:enhancing lycopene biosynthesis protein 2